VGVTVAVKATGWLTVEGFGVDVRVVVVLEADTVSRVVATVPALKF
jgi:hypothetical protein